MSYLFFDTETTGFFLKSVPRNDAKQPHIVQIAGLLTDERGNTIEELDLIVKPEGWEIPQVVADIHGITTEIALAKGIPAKDALAKFNGLVERATLLIAHNFSFDNEIVAIAHERHAVVSKFHTIPYVCTMLECTPICKMAKKRGAGYKWPKLMEAYELICKKKFSGAHNAVADMHAMKEVFFWIKEQEEKGVDLNAIIL